MQTAIIVFPGSNRDRDMIAAVEKISGKKPHLVWHQEPSLPKADVVILPGGFSYGDYLRSGAIAARAPIMQAVREAADKGAYVLGVCNGFQILTEAGLLPGTLMRNASLKFICHQVQLQTVNNRTPFTQAFGEGEVWDCPVAHHDGNYFAEDDVLKSLQDNDQIAFTYANGTNPNGSVRDIAGVFDTSKRILGMMPHPENLIEAAHGGTAGRGLFEGLLNGVNA